MPSYLTPEFVARVEAGAGHVTAKGYRRALCPDGKMRMAHVIIWESERGGVPCGCAIHHLNGDKLDNRIENLSAVNHLDHKRMHSPNYQREGPAWFKHCPDCRRWLRPTSEFWYLQRGYPGSYCRACWVRRVVKQKRARRDGARLLRDRPGPDSGVGGDDDG